MKMKILLIAIALFVAVEARAYQWTSYGPNIQTGRGNNPPRGPSWMQQNNILGPDVEWVCQNPKTNDMMIIAADNTQHHHPGRGPWRQWQNVPGQRREQQGQYFPQPIIIVEGPDDNNQISPSNPVNNDNNNNDNQPQTTPHYHGGEGLIDVRMGA